MVVPNNPWVFLIKMIILGCFGDTTIEGNTHMVDFIKITTVESKKVSFKTAIL